MAGPTRIVVVRHGETEWSASGQHTSRTDLPLLEAGREQARALAPVLEGQRFALILSSPMKRALETCELAGFGADVTVSDALCEWDYGEYEGLTTREIRSRAPEWNLWRDGCPGGESPEQIGSRADRALGELGEVDGDVLVFAHGHILRVFSARWLGCPVDFGAHLLLSAGSLCVLGLDRGTRAIVRWNAVPGTVL